MGFFLQLLSDPEYPEIRNQVKKSHILAHPSHLLYSEHVLIKKVKGFDAVVSRSRRFSPMETTLTSWMLLICN